jgi:hypothetical protein
VGLKASGGRVGHNQVWARDSMIALLGARYSSDETIQCALRATTATLKNKQSPSGALPNNVDVESNRANFRCP